MRVDGEVDFVLTEKKIPTICIPRPGAGSGEERETDTERERA